MPLSIRNSKSERLARELAAESGETITQAITQALKERLERLRGRNSATDYIAEIIKISILCSALPDKDNRTAEQILGYDDNGVPV